MVRNTFEVQNVGDLLREKRKKLGIDIKQVADDTKIRTEYLLALEAGNFEKFPASVYARGFLQKYAKYLGINPERVAAMYRREAKTRGKENLKSTEFFRSKLPTGNFDISTNRIITGIVVLILVLFGIYIVSQASSILKEPELSLTAPIEAQQGETKTFTTSDESIDLKGKVEIGSTLKLNGSEININNIQEFTIDNIPLNDGDNQLKLVARSQFGRESIIDLIVIRDENAGSTPVSNPSDETPTSTTDLNTSIVVAEGEAFVQVAVDGDPTFAQVLAAGTNQEFTATSEISISSTNPGVVNIFINEQPFTLENSREHIYTIDSDGNVAVEVQ